MDANPEQSRRQSRRAFIRTHHPDIGGDPADFVAGLAGLDAEPHAESAAEPDATPSTNATAGSRADTQAQPDQPWPVSLTTVLLRRARGHKRPPRVR